MPRKKHIIGIGRPDIVETKSGAIYDGKTTEARPRESLSVTEHLQRVLVCCADSVKDLQQSFSPTSQEGILAYAGAATRLDPFEGVWVDEAERVYYVNDRNETYCVFDFDSEADVPRECKLPGDALLTFDERFYDAAAESIASFAPEWKHRIMPPPAPAVSDVVEDWRQEIIDKANRGDRVIELPYDKRQFAPQVKAHVLMVKSDTRRALLVAPKAGCSTCGGTGGFDYSVRRGKGKPQAGPRQACVCVIDAAHKYLYPDGEPEAPVVARKPQRLPKTELDIERLRKKLQDAEAALAVAQSDVAAARVEFDARIDRRRAKARGLEVEIERHTANMDELNKEAQDNGKLRDELLERVQKLDQQRQVIQNEYEALHKARAELVRSLNTVRAASAEDQTAWNRREADIRRKHNTAKLAKTVSRYTSKIRTLEAKVQRAANPEADHARGTGPA